MPAIVFLDRASIRAVVRRPGFPHAWTEYPATEPEETFERLRDAAIAIVNKVRLPGELLARLPALRLIANSTVACHRAGEI